MREADSLYNRFKTMDEKVKKKIFKTRLLKPKEYSVCDICGERLKIGTITILSPYFHVKGHIEHVNEHIQNMYKSMQSGSK